MVWGRGYGKGATSEAVNAEKAVVGRRGGEEREGEEETEEKRYLGQRNETTRRRGGKGNKG